MLSLSSRSLTTNPFSSLSGYPIRRTRLSITAAFTMPGPAAAATVYELLSVTETAGPVEIKAAYRRQARRWHPDTCPPHCDKGRFTEQFMRVHEACEILSDPDRWQDYDLTLRIGAAIPAKWAAAFNGAALFRRLAAMLGHRTRAGSGSGGPN